MSQWLLPIVRMRHALGFGVHSPLAFRMVINVVQERYRYRGYWDIEASTENRHVSNRMSRQARLLLRLAARTGVRKALIPREMDSVFLQALYGARRGMTLLTSLPAEGESLIVVSDTTNEDAALRAVSLPGCVIYAVSSSPEGLDRIEKAMEHGLLLRDRHSAIAVMNPKLLKTVYDISLP